jgi:hypothetical protein
MLYRGYGRKYCLHLQGPTQCLNLEDQSITTYHYMNIFILTFTEPVWSPYWNHGWSVKSKDMPASLQLPTLIVYTWIEFPDFLHVFSVTDPKTDYEMITSLYELYSTKKGDE